MACTMLQDLVGDGSQLELAGCPNELVPTARVEMILMHELFLLIEVKRNQLDLREGRLVQQREQRTEQQYAIVRVQPIASRVERRHMQQNRETPGRGSILGGPRH